ncbi:MAG: nucleoside hydrolase [Candidatus Pacebacteria bacterium]|jgi:inosine-uridine nucleoside N-ribohydrolase|nr:hypothetical protein [bacterium]MDP6527986.1 nucleoside hydrolase [Candidatus Paceibacterota bacterium]MDP6659756.1 nucleoside hydrolase [Candidatus Paceibacterota bacterium]|tara:strand:- start:13630 stop:14538 length:909 start_codon:yes stop_codon:yes gene_type:complete
MWRILFATLFAVLLSWTAEAKKQVWIDADPACGEMLQTSDPDDCVAILMAIRSGSFEIAGISTVGGNARLPDTWQVALRLVDGSHPIYRGSFSCKSRDVFAFAQAAERGGLTVLALGPLTNIARYLKCRPDLAEKIKQIVFVGSRRHDEEFVINDSWLTGFSLRDLNVEHDPQAVEDVLSTGVAIRYVPFAAGNAVHIAYGEFAGSHPNLPEWLMERIRDWGATQWLFLGADGRVPFDEMAVALLLDENEQLFSCEPVQGQMVAGNLIVELAQGASGNEEVCLPTDKEGVRKLILSAVAGGT